MKDSIGPIAMVVLMMLFAAFIIFWPDPRSQRENKAITTCYPYQVKTTYEDNDKWMAVCATPDGTVVKEMVR